MSDLFPVDRTCEYNGEVYRVVSVLDNDLLLVVNQNDLDNKQFPLDTKIIPDQFALDFQSSKKQ